MGIVDMTVYRVICDKCGNYLSHIFDDTTLEEVINFHSISQCKHMIEKYGWNKIGSNSYLCPDCQNKGN